MRRGPLLFSSQPERRFQPKPLAPFVLSNSCLISPQGDTAGASLEATGYLSARPLPFGDLAVKRVGKNTDRLTTQDRMTGRLKTPEACNG